MTNIQLSGVTGEVEPGLKNLLEYYSFPGVPEEEKISIAVERLGENAPVSLRVGTKNGLRIAYRETAAFFRALSILLQHRTQRDFQKQETARFEGCSTMIDLSRNAVCTVDELKRLLCFMALAGHNRCYLYMEDTYELPGYPYFGYLRGRYSLNELREIDGFAHSLGIEAVPWIQTLAHLKNALQWGYAASMRDTDDILLVGEEETYRLIEAMIATMKRTFRTKKINIGMDEAMALGTGAYLRKHGFENQFQLMLRHLNRVNGIVSKYGMSPIMCDDMFYRTHDANHEYYNTDIRLSREDLARVPENMSLVFWDYYHDREKEYDELLAMRDGFPNRIIFAGGVWRWMGFVPGYSKTFVSSNAALAACERHRVSEIMATAWADDGAETPVETILPGIILFGERCFGEPSDKAAVSRRCEFLTGLSLDDFCEIEQLDILPGCENPNLKTRNPSKQILYQDLLLGALDRYFDKPEIASHYTACEKRLLEIAGRAGRYSLLFRMYASLARVLGQKAALGSEIRSAYRGRDDEKLREIVQTTLPRLKEDVLTFQKQFARVWFYENKGQGFEIMDIRLGGLAGRIDTATARLADYLGHRISAVEELEEDPLPFTEGDFSDEVYVCCNSYRKIVSQNTLAHL
ncbi:beta-N-acetylhexosaminidase [Caproicibacter sp.]|uniref:beta-N-acetylhexosaminidase n=1 Tax=Caproicibacter sp. TaxID=2814884 RepID=UPI00398A2940